MLTFFTFQQLEVSTENCVSIYLNSLDILYRLILNIVWSQQRRSRWIETLSVSCLMYFCSRRKQDVEGSRFHPNLIREAEVKWGEMRWYKYERSNFDLPLRCMDVSNWHPTALAASSGSRKQCWWCENQLWLFIIINLYI